MTDSKDLMIFCDRLMDGANVGEEMLGTILDPTGIPMFSKILLAGAGFILNEAKRQLESEGVDPDFSKSDPDVLLELAHTASMKQKLVRDLWKALLKNALDPNNVNPITKSEINLLKSLDSIEVLLLHTITHYHEQIFSDVENLTYNTLVKYRQNDSARGVQERYLITPASVLNMIETAHGLRPAWNELDMIHIIDEAATYQSEGSKVFDVRCFCSLKEWDFPAATRNGLVTPSGGLNVVPPYFIEVSPRYRVKRLMEKIGSNLVY